MAVSHRARIEAYIGASGSGKGVSIRRRLAELKPARLVVWDPRDEYRDIPRVSSLRDLAAGFLGSSSTRPARARYVPTGRNPLPDEFELVCRVAFEAGNLLLLAEELSDVTQPSWAPPAWRRLLTQGRHQALHILGAAQRPALVDKVFLANCTRIRCGALGYEPDRKAMAVELDCARDLVADLASLERPGGGADIRMLERDRQTRRFFGVRLVVSSGGKVTETVREIPARP